MINPNNKQAIKSRQQQTPNNPYDGKVHDKNGNPNKMTKTTIQTKKVQSKNKQTLKNIQPKRKSVPKKSNTKNTQANSKSKLTTKKINTAISNKKPLNRHSTNVSRPASKKIPPKVNSRMPSQQALQIKRKKEARLKKIRLERIKFLKLFFARFVLFACVFAFLLVFSVAMFFINLFSNNIKTNKKDYTYIIDTGINKEHVSDKVPYNKAIIDKTQYINFSRLAELYEFTITGDIKEIRFIVNDIESNQVIFSVNGNYIIINDMKTHVSQKLYIIDDNYYVPISFIENYVKGLNVVYDNENRKVILTRELVTASDFGDDSAVKEIKYKPIYFTPKTMTTSESIPEYTVMDLFIEPDEEI